MCNILLCGVGGQGTVLASKLIAAAAAEKGMKVMSAETIGMAQKGGSVSSFLRVGDGVYTPIFRRKCADIIIAFEPAEAVRMIDYLKDGGTVVVNTHAVMPVTAALAGSDYTADKMIKYLRTLNLNLIETDCDKACAELGSAKITNTVLLGAAAKSGELPFTVGDLEAALAHTVKPQLCELNKKALWYGAQGC